jgi:hypothetical protein
MREIIFTPRFDRMFRRLPARVRLETYEKLALFQDDATHPSLRVKRIKCTELLWEMSIAMNYRVTFEITLDELILRRIGTHDILRNP